MGGPSEAVEECLLDHMPLGFDGRFEMVVLTHPQQDHLKGLFGVVKRYEVGLLVANNVSNSSKTFWEFRQLVDDNNIRVVASTGNEIFQAGSLKFESLWPRENYNSNISI